MMRFLSAASSLREENTGTRVASLWLATYTSCEVWSSRYTVNAFVEAGFSLRWARFYSPTLEGLEWLSPPSSR